jgi:hypothetical protein
MASICGNFNTFNKIKHIYKASHERNIREGRKTFHVVFKYLPRSLL